MKHTCETVIQAPFNTIFLAAADVARWPEYLSHYRYNRFLQHSPSGGVLKTSWTRTGLSINGISEYHIDTMNHQLHFHHTHSSFGALAGMKVTWDFTHNFEGDVAVSITHVLKKRVPVLGAAAEWLLIKALLDDNATRTLAGLKRKVEMQLLIQN